MTHESGVLPVSISDHLPIYVIKKKDRPLTSFKTIKGRSYTHYNKDLLADLLLVDGRRASYWCPGNNPDILWDIMLGIIRIATDKLSPMVNVRTRDDKPGWYTKEINRQY